MDGFISQEDLRALLFIDNLLINLVHTTGTALIMQMTHVAKLVLTTGFVISKILRRFVRATQFAGFRSLFHG